MRQDMTRFSLFFSFVFLCISGVTAQSGLNKVVMTETASRDYLTLAKGANEIQICGLTPGETYGFMMNGQVSEDCIDEVTIQNGAFVQVTTGTIHKFKAAGSCVTLQFDVNCGNPIKDMNTWLSSFCMSCKSASSIGKRYDVSPNSNAEYLIKEVFIGGGCFDVSGVTSIGAAGGLGEFSDGGPIGIESGVIMASGNVTNSQGPNNSGSAGNSFGQPGDPDLTLISNQNTFDATGIEFDFQPTIPHIEFKYAFASEEYPEYVCAGFNDVFGFFISGPGISGAFSNNSDNIAWIPGTFIPVGINTVNPGVAGAFGNPANCMGKGSLNYSQYYVDNTGGQELQYDGWTTVFTAEIDVEICAQYHIKLVVADAGDGIFDSAVFLEANSFNAGGEANLEFASPSTGTNLVYEKCDDGIITICKSSPADIDIDVVLEFTVNSMSTATAGVDYTNLPTQFLIPAGEECIEFQLDVIDDVIEEGIETILLELEIPCSCENPFVEILIADTPPLGVEVEDFSICENDGVDIDALVSGGVEDYEFLWNTGDDGESISLFPSTSGMYTVTVTDQCGQEVTATSNVTVYPRPIATLEGDGKLCAGDPNAEVNLSISFSPPGSSPWELTYMINGVPQTPLTGITNSPYILTVNEAGPVDLLTVYSGGLCEGTVEGGAFIEEVVIEPFFDTTGVSCQGIDDGSISVFAYGGTEPYQYFWSNGFGWTDLLDPVGVGTYYVTITDDQGCTLKDSVILSSPADITVNGMITGGTACKDATGSVDLVVAGGNGPFNFSWSNGNTNEDPDDLPAGVNSVTVTDSRGCQQYADFVIVASDAPAGNAQALTGVDCADPFSGSADLTVNGGLPPYMFNWSGNGGSNEDPVGLGGGLYKVTVTDDGGCTTVVSVTIPVDTLPPLAEAGLPDTLNCGITSLNLDGTGSDQGNSYSYQWTTTNGNILSGATSLTPTIGLPGTYQIVVTNSLNGCTAMDIVKVLPDNDSPTVQIDPIANVTCKDTTTVIDASGSSSGPNYTASWSTANGVITSGGNTLMPTVGAPGVYTLTLVNASNNCVSVEDVTVEGDLTPPPVDILPPAVITCANPSITLDGSGSLNLPGTQYIWTTSNGNIVNGFSSDLATVNAKGVYTLEVVNPVTGCINSKTVNVIEDKVKPLSNAAAPEILNCTNTVVDLIGTGSSTGADYTYKWSTFLGNITGSNSSINTECDKPGTYVLTVTNLLNGCTSSVTTVVDLDTVPPVAYAGAGALIDCSDPIATLNGTGSSNTAAMTYQWTTPNGNILAGANSLTPTVNQTGTYTLLVTDTDNGCTAQSSTVVDGDVTVPQVIIQDPDKLTCTIDEVVLDGSQSDFSSAIQYLWTTGSGNIVSGSTTVTPTVNAAGSYTLTATNTDNGCTGSASVVVKEDKTIPKADAGKPSEIYCLGDSVILDGSKSSTGTFYTYDWYLELGGPASFLNEQTPATSESGTYYLVVTDTRNGCTAVDEVEIGSDYLQSADIKMSDPICYNDPGTLEIYNVIGGLYPYQYSLDGGTSYQYNPRFRNLSSGAYKMVVKDAKGCIIKKDFEIPDVNELLVHVDPVVYINLGEEIRLEAQLNIDISQVGGVTWYPAYGLDRTDSLVVFAQPYITTPYFISVVDINGCPGQTEMKIIVRDPNIFIPTAFSPHNNDGNNDIFMIFAQDFGIQEVELFEVFTRWGERVFHAEKFQANDENYGWNGMYQGNLMNPAVFVYYAKIKLIDGRVLTLKGDVSLLE
ncbi:MAG: choice-of-anchor L domain-containing protein [Saprospiraceae bacterium]|nr:choice-of-anchor L domain-containing protein [Saprospiraceae bacterium]